MSSPRAFNPSCSQPQPIPNPQHQHQHQHHPPPIPSIASQDSLQAQASHPSYDFNPSTDSYHQHLQAHEISAPPQNFLPIFTLIEDSSTSEHFHPRVHYVFADDPFDPVSAFTPLSSSSPPTTQDGVQPPRPAERAIVVDLLPDLTSIKSAYSLSPDWQILNVSLSSAPQSLMSDDPAPSSTQNPSSFSSSNPNLPRNSSTTSLNTITNFPTGSSPEMNRAASALPRPSASESLMLTIEGTKIPGGGVSELNLKRLGDMGDSGLYDLASTFSERMSTIKRVIEFGMAQELARNNDVNANGNVNALGTQQHAGDVGSFQRVAGNASPGSGTGTAMAGFKMERVESARSAS